MPRLDGCWAVVQIPLRHGCNESAKADNHRGYLLTGAVGNGLHRQPRDKPGPRLRVAHNRCMDVDTSVAASAAKRVAVHVRPSHHASIMRWISVESVMAAMTRTCPPQRGHLLRSIANTRRSRCIQLIAARDLAGGASSCSSTHGVVGDTEAMMWRRCLAFGANTP